MKKISFSQLTNQITKQYPTIKVTRVDEVIFLDGQLPLWEQIVNLGYLAARVKSEGVVNRISLANHIETPVRISKINDQAYQGMQCDVLVIGGGIIGCSILRELSKLDLSAVLIEKENDVALHASSRNDGCIHVGLDLNPKSKKHYYLRESHKIYQQIAAELNVEYNQNGQLLVFTKNSQRLLIPIFKYLAKSRKVIGARLILKRELFELEPAINPESKFAFFAPQGANICPFSMCIALAENAIENGAQILLNTAALSMEVNNGIIQSVLTNRGRIYPKVVINAAGTFADKVAAQAQDQFFTIHPRKGIELILDKKARAHSVNRSTSIYAGTQDKKKGHTKGGGVIPTVDGNVLVGPTAYETPEREDFTTDRHSVEQLIAKHRLTTPALQPSDVITYFAGVRAATYEEDFIVRKGKWTKNIVHAAGIQSPGLTAAPAIALDIVKFAQEILGGNIIKKSDFNPNHQSIPVTKTLDLDKRNQLIMHDANYGRIVCRCEEVSRGEIIAALHRPLAIDSVDAIKRRVRAGMGRCQGGFCQQQIVQIIAEEKKISLEQVVKKGEGTILLRKTKEAHRESL